MPNPYDGLLKKRWAAHLKVVWLVNHNLPETFKSMETVFDEQSFVFAAKAACAMSQFPEPDQALLSVGQITSAFQKSCQAPEAKIFCFTFWKSEL